MNFQDYLRSLMLQTAKDFDKAASTDPVIENEERDNIRINDLDQVLANQKAEREALWKKLHQLEEKQRSLKSNHVFSGVAGSDRKRLMMLQYEEKELSREREKQEKDIPIAPVTNNETLSNIQFKERLQRSVTEMTELVEFIKSQLTDVATSYQRELNNIKECQQIQDALVRKSLELEVEGIPSAAQRSREKMAKAQQQYHVVMESLMDFLEDYYPPHFVDNADYDGEEDSQNLSDMKFILEDLMNRAVLNPSNPYIELKEGTYWSPYIETLVKGNIAKRDPENSKRLKLVDFRIY